MRAIPWLAAAVCATLLTSPAALAQTAGLEIVQPETLAFESAAGSTKAVSVWVSNPTDKQVTPAFTLVVEDSDGKPVNGLNVNAQAGDGLAPGVVGRYRLSVTGATADTDVAGRLVAGASGVAAGSVAVTIAPANDPVFGVDTALWIAVALAFVLCVVGIALAGGSRNVSTAIPKTDFDFGKSLATTITAVGAVFGTVLGADVLPAETGTLSTAGFTALNLVFLAAIAIAAGIPELSRHEDGSGTRLGLFWLAAFITTWAAFGELYALWRLVDELGATEGFSSAATVIFYVLIAAGAASMVVYVPRRIADVTELAPSTSGILPAAATSATPLL
jgi:hypothetical protein